MIDTDDDGMEANEKHWYDEITTIHLIAFQLMGIQILLLMILIVVASQ
jgi:hypothetical protein